MPARSPKPKAVKAIQTSSPKPKSAKATKIAKATSPKPKPAASPNPNPPEPQSSENFRLSDLIVEATGEVLRVLEDDLEGSRHQRFVVRLKTYDVLVCHNIDLSPRIEELAAGDRVSFKGEYEWSDQGGTIHWTHKDPKGWHPDGWIDHGGKRYD